MPIPLLVIGNREEDEIMEVSSEMLSPVIFAFHGYEDLVQSIFFRRHNHNLYVHGYREDGDITTPFDIRVMNELDRFHLAKEAATSVYGTKAAEFNSTMDDTLQKHHDYIRSEGTDLPEIENWHWEDVNKD